MIESKRLQGAEAAAAVRQYEAHTMGTEQNHRHWTNMLVHTDGTEFLAQTCGAYWLVDLVASHQPDIKRKLHELGEHEDSLQVWRLLHNSEDAWKVEAWSDTPGESELLAEQVISFSDFPTELSGFEWWVENGVMLLKAER